MNFTKNLKLILPGLAFFILLLLFLFPEFQAIKEETKLKIPKIDIKNPSLFQIEGARFFAYDLKGRPFSIEIKKATEKNSKDNIVFFENIEGEIQLDGQNWVVFEAGKGHFDIEKKIMYLFNSVSIMSNEGYYIDGDQMEINIETMFAKSSSHIVAHGNFGNLEANGFEYVAGEKLNFKGPIKAIVKPNTN
ncbi:MAG: LPS export ABC transporter periplasmic protein LptC [Alphaproteobacteria bacterium]|nr:MAG: hypothetical protein B6I23_00205 [Rickettsiaceae bacterium 4572_127]